MEIILFRDDIYTHVDARVLQHQVLLRIAAGVFVTYINSPCDHISLKHSWECSTSGDHEEWTTLRLFSTTFDTLMSIICSQREHIFMLVYISRQLLPYRITWIEKRSIYVCVYCIYISISGRCFLLYTCMILFLSSIAVETKLVR